MDFQHDGISLWYGADDTPAPGQTVTVGVRATITIGISPTDASNTVEVLYRINQGATAGIAAQFLKNSRDGRSQYFRATLPAFNLGETVEYNVIGRCAGRQVPPKDALKEFTSSFTVVEAGAKKESDRPAY